VAAAWAIHLGVPVACGATLGADPLAADPLAERAAGTEAGAAAPVEVGLA
jgi:hypothetical protein